MLTLLCVLIVFLFARQEKKSDEAEVELKAYALFPEADKVVETEKYGEVAINEILVVLDENEDRSKAEELANALNGEIVGELEYLNLFQIRTDAESEDEFENYLNETESKGYVELASPNSALYLEGMFGEPCSLYEDVYEDHTNSLPFKMAGVEKAWRYIRGSGVSLNEVHVGVVDTGLNKETLDKDGDITVQTLENKDYVLEKNGHGTSVTNIIGGTWENGGIRGVAGGLGNKLTLTSTNTFTTRDIYREVPEYDPKNPAQVYIKSEKKAYLVTDFVEIYKQIKKGATVINYSVGFSHVGPQYKKANDMYRMLLSKIASDNPKVLFVAAAGNEGDEGVQLDGTNYSMGGISLPNVITVGGLDNSGDTYEYSNTATGNGEVTLAACATEVPVGYNEDGTVATNTGTSFATPQVTSAAAILRSINPDLSAKEIKDILVATAASSITNKEISSEEKAVEAGIGGKVLQIDKAVLKVLKELPDDKRPANLDEEFLDKVTYINATATVREGDALTYDIVAEIEAVRPGGTEVKIELQGAGQVTGESIKRIDKPGTLSWSFGFFKEGDEATLVITRLDTQACVRLFLKAIPEYTGQAVIPLPDMGMGGAVPKITLDAKVEILPNGEVSLEFIGQGEFSVTDSGYTHVANYDMKITAIGILNEQNKIDATGTYTFDYVVTLDPQVAAFLGMSTIPGVTTGDVQVVGERSGNTVTGTIIFDSNPATTGTFTAQAS